MVFTRFRLFVKVIIVHVLLLLLCSQRVLSNNIVGQSENIELQNQRCPERCQCDLTTSTVKCSGLQVIPLITHMDALDLQIRNSKIPIIKNNTFEQASLAELTHLTLDRCGIEEIESYAFQNLVSLKYLIITGNNFAEIDVNLFKANIKLRDLNLRQNSKLTTLTGGPFPPLPGLYWLELTSCNFSKLEKNIFRHLDDLHWLDLEINKFVEFDLRFFESTPKVSRILLEKNTGLTTLNVGAFPSLFELTLLDMGWCNLSAVQNNIFHELVALERLHISGNKFVEIDLNLFKNNIKLTYLYMDGNKHLTTLTGDKFPILPELQILTLHSCNLSHLPNNTFVNLGGLQQLELYKNKFKSLDVNILRPLKALKLLNLESNPWNCDCELKDLWKFYDKKIGLNKTGDALNCFQPQRLIGPWKSLNSGDFECPAGRDPPAINQTKIPETSKDSSVQAVIISVAIFAAALGICLFGAAVYFFKFRSRYNNLSGISEQEIEAFRIGNPDTPRTDEAMALNYIENMPFDKVYELNNSYLTWDRKAILGKGAFGIVYKGIYMDQPVAIKTILTQQFANSSSNDAITHTRALLSEIKVMCYLAEKDTKEQTGQMNIVNFIGASLSNGILLVSEFCELGCLQNFLRNHQTNFRVNFTYANISRASAPLSTGQQFISSADLTKWAYDIANGMAFISERNLIHGDLASRNVLLTKNRVAKISDFGLSRRLYEYSSYTKKNQEPLPWRWMSLEALKYLTFSTESDVWSYGITLWEIFSLAEVPYPGLTWTYDFVETLERGLRPNRPKHASENIYGLMEQTWLADPSERKSFAEIREIMRMILDEYTKGDQSQICQDTAI